MDITELSKRIDHSLLKPFFTDDDLREGCEIAKKYEVASMCVRPTDVPLVSRELEDSGIPTCTVIGFPHGTTTTATKIAESRDALNSGATELDIVQNIGRFKSGHYQFVQQELKHLTDLAHESEAKVKIIFENCYLEDDEIVRMVEICNDIGVDWIKTSTGFGSGGAEVDDVKLMIKHAAEDVQVKASGGIRTLEDALTMKELGCTRIGASATVQILEEFKKRKS